MKPHHWIWLAIILVVGFNGCSIKISKSEAGQARATYSVPDDSVRQAQLAQQKAAARRAWRKRRRAYLRQFDRPRRRRGK